MMLREGLTGLATPPYYIPSPQHQQQRHPPLYPGDFNMSMYPPSTSSRIGHPPPHGGGLFTAADMPSPAVSFQMSMVDTSTPTNLGGRGGPPFRGGMGDVTGIKDLNNYLPVHKVKLEGYPKRLFTVENNVTGETIVVLTSTQRVQLFMLKIKNDEDAKNTSEKFEFEKFHELIIQPNDLEGFAISQNCSITLVPFKLTYALSTRSGKVVYVYDQGNSNEVPNKLTLGNFNGEIPSPYIIPFEHDYSVTQLAIDAEKDYLGCIQELGTVMVWDIASKEKMATFHIPNQGIHISFHRSEPFQLMVVDASGFARFFNIFRQCCFRSIHLVHSPVFSAEWSLSNSNIFSAGFAESFTIIDTSKLISSLNKVYEVPEHIINAVRINPIDDKVYATLSRLSGTIQLWKDNFATHIWKHKNAHVNDIAWVHGFPFLLALGHQTLFVYDASLS